MIGDMSPVLRPVASDDLPFLDSLHDDETYAFFAVNHRPTRAELERQIAESSGTAVDFRMICAGPGEPVGWIRADLDRANALAQLGYGLARAQWGHGYATDAVRIMVNALFGRGDVEKIWARVDPRNDRSLKVLQRAGFFLEGTLQSHFIRRGERVSRALFGLTRGQWRQEGVLRLNRGLSTLDFRSKVS